MLFFYCYACLSITLTSDNSSLYFTDMQHIPFFAILVSDWCPHCVASTDVFDEIESIYSNDSRLLVFRINCDRDASICRRFPETSTPGLFWIYTTPEQSEQYNGAVSTSNIKSFIEKHFGETYIDIKNKEEYEKELNEHKESSIFVYQKSETNDMTNTLRYIASSMTNYPCHFFNLKFALNESEKEKQVLFNINPEFGITVYFNESFNVSNIEAFINKFAFPPISHISELFFNHAYKNNYTVLLLADEVPLFEERYRMMIPKLPPELRTGVVYCGSSPRLCRALLISQGKGPQIQMYNPSKKYQYYYKDDLNERDLTLWINNVLSGKTRAAGSGAGFSGFIYDIFDNARRNGIVPLVLTAMVFVVFILTFVFGAASSWQRYQRKKAYYSKLE